MSDTPLFDASTDQERLLLNRSSGAVKFYNCDGLLEIEDRQDPLRGYWLDVDDAADDEGWLAAFEWPDHDETMDEWQTVLHEFDRLCASIAAAQEIDAEYDRRQDRMAESKILNPEVWNELSKRPCTGSFREQTCKAARLRRQHKVMSVPVRITQNGVTSLIMKPVSHDSNGFRGRNKRGGLSVYRRLACRQSKFMLVEAG